MRTSICLWFILLLATPLYAETYSWIDDSGTYNFTEDYAKVPKKYQKKVKRRDDLQQEVKPQATQVPGSAAPRTTEKPDTNTAAVPGDEKEMFGGKSRAAWRGEMASLEAELSSIEKRLEQLKKEILGANVLPKAQFDVLKKELDDSRATYDKKYKSYTELIETIRKAGIPVEIKK